MRRYRQRTSARCGHHLRGVAQRKHIYEYLPPRPVLRSLQSTNVKSCCVSKTQPSACCSDDRKSRNRLWHLLTSAIDMARPGYYLHSGLLMFAIPRVRWSRSSTHRGGRVRARKRRKVRSWLTGVDRLSVCQSARRKRPVCVPGSDCDAQNRSSAADGCA